MAFWNSLTQIPSHQLGPCYVLGYFNSVLNPFDSIGGNDISDNEFKDFVDCMAQCELQEMRSFGSYFAWITKSIWSKINRAMMNLSWFGAFEYV